jgi:hypothetical protein
LLSFSQMSKKIPLFNVWALRARGWGEPPTYKILSGKPTMRSNFCLLTPAQLFTLQGISLADTYMILADGKVAIGDPMHRLADGNVSIELLDIDFQAWFIPTFFSNPVKKVLEPERNVFATTQIWALDLPKFANHLMRLQIDWQKSGKSYF